MTGPSPIACDRTVATDAPPDGPMLTLWRDGEPVAAIILPTSLALSLAADLLAIARNRMAAWPDRWPIPDKEPAGGIESPKPYVNGASRCEALQTLPIFPLPRGRKAMISHDKR